MQPQKITTFLWFDGQAEQAAKFYTSLFENSRVVQVTPMVVTFELAGLRYLALNGGPKFKFNEAISLMVSCETQEEVDRLWSKLIADGGAPSQCGWLKDKFGLSWQIVPTVLMELMGDSDPQKAGRVGQAMMGMGKLDIAALKRAHKGS